jgi:small subunit ribosomal protein S7
MRRKTDKIRSPRVSEQRKEKERRVFNLKLFNKWDSNVSVNDPGLKPYINLEARVVPRSAGRLRNTFHKSKAHIVERLASHILVAGHKGKRHKLTSGKYGGKTSGAIQAIIDAFNIIEEKDKRNPIEVLVRAIENSALREEIISFQVGSVMAREAVITAPQRRVDKSLRFFAQGSYNKAFNKKINLSGALADELIAASQGKDCFAIKEKERIEREAEGAR